MICNILKDKYKFEGTTNIYIYIIYIISGIRFKFKLL